MYLNVSWSCMDEIVAFSSFITLTESYNYGEQILPTRGGCLD